MIYTKFDPKELRAISAQREYVEAVAHGVAFAAHDHNTLWIWRFSAEQTEPSIRERSTNPNAPFYVFVARPNHQDEIIVVPLEKSDDWTNVAHQFAKERWAAR